MYKDHPQANALDFLIEITNMLGPYNPRTQPDEFKLVAAIQQFVGYYADGVFAGVESWSEQDLVTHVWSVLDRFFHPLGVMTSRDRTCLATSQRMDSDRAVTGSSEVKGKKRSIRPDLVLLKNCLEYGCSELGTNLSSVSDKKEIVETQLHNPKTMKDMLHCAIAKAGNEEEVARMLKIVCFNETGLSISLSVMDCPNGYVNRITNSKNYEVPREPELMVSQLFPVFKLALTAKIIVENSVAVINKHLLKEQELQFDFEATSTKLTLPSCLTAPILPITRKRKLGNSESAVASSKRPTNTSATSSKQSPKTNSVASSSSP
ncbi:hypothetical protein BJV82DRAFT_713857 [Fennellomyces sp. T-0311]|nr:hypothetical protein BJV82DRAFT_713857 [Fennellomyces sp. T-0311]